jgi:hypothetical protein
MAGFLDPVRAQTGKKIPSSTAAQLTATAVSIRDTIGC